MLIKTIIDIYSFFKHELETRAVLFDEKYNEKEILNSSWSLQRYYAYDFHFSGKPDALNGSTSVVIVFYLTGTAMLVFNWRKPGVRKEEYLKSTVFSQNKLSKELLLDILASFLKNEIKAEQKSKRELLLSIRKIN